MRSESTTIRRLFEKLINEPRHRFPAKGETLNAPRQQGVYIIRKGKVVFHVGRTTRAKTGLHHRLTQHLHGRSSFTKATFDRDGDRLRERYDYQTLVVPNPRRRALHLEFMARDDHEPQPNTALEPTPTAP
jgi:hypothetical protein